MIELDFAALLESVPAVVTSAPGRVYPLIIPTDPALPAVSYSFISTTPSATFDGHGTQRTRVEVNVWAEFYGDAVTLRHDLIQTLDGSAAHGLTVRFLSKHDYFDSVARQYRAMVEFYLFSSI